jgi:hypothetical protein
MFMYKICDFFGSTVMAPNTLKFNFRGPHTFFFVNFELGFSVTASWSPQIAIYFIVIYNEIEKRKVWGPRGKTYLSNKKRTLPSSVVVLKIWMFKNTVFRPFQIR